MRKPTARAVRSKTNRDQRDVLRRACRGATPAPFEGLESRRLFAIVQPAGQDYLAFEAEHAEAVFTDLADADTVTWSVISGDAALGLNTAPTGGAAIIANRPAGGADNNAGSATYPVQLREAGPYTVYARVKYSGGGDNSAYVPADGGPINAPATAIFDNRTESLNDYHWVSQNPDGAVTYDYTNPTPGVATTFQINIREANYIIDRIVLSQSERTPEQLDAISPATQQVLRATTRSTQRNTAILTFSPVAAADGGYDILRSTTGTAGSFTRIATGVTETTFTDPETLAANTTYFYQVRPVNGGVAGPVSNTASVTAGQGLIGHYYNSGFWGNGTGFGNRPANPFTNATTELGGQIAVLNDGSVTEFVPQVAFDYGNGSPAPEIGVDNHSTVFVGKVRTNEAGDYQFAGFGDDDTYVFVNGVLVSADPGGHGIPGNASEIEFKRTLNLAANTEYDVVVLQSEGGGGSGVFLRYTTPTNATYTNVPTANLRQTTSLPNAPTGVTRDTASRTGGVEIDFVDASTNELRYELERSTNGVDFTTVSGRSGITGINGTTLNDLTAVVGQTYQYRVVAVNFDGRAASAPVTVAVAAPTAGQGATGYYFNSQFWGDTRYTAYQASVADVQPDFFETVSQVAFDYGTSSPKPGIIQDDNHSTVFTGKLRAPETGTYQILGFTDDDSYVWVNNQLVSADPGGHGIPGSAAEIDFRAPIQLTAGQEYNYVAMQSEGGGGSGIFLRWTLPSAPSSIVNIPSSAYVSNIPNAAPDKATGAPADPTGFAASEVGEFRAVLTWNDQSANELRYIIEKSPTATFTDFETIRVPINATSYVDQNLNSATRYFYRLRAENYFGDSANVGTNFQTRAVNAGDAPPAAPANVSARARSTGIVVTFTDNSFFEESFSVQRQGTDGSFTEVGTVDRAPAGTATGRGAILSFEDTSVVGTPGTYTYRVVAINTTTGNSAPSGTATATFPPTAAGTGLTATYFNEQFFAGPGVALANPASAFENFGEASPDAAVDADTFSGVLEGYFLAETTEQYTFRTSSDDGVSLRLFDPATGATILNFDNINTYRGLNAGFEDFAGTANLVAGTRYGIQIRMNEGGGGAGYKVGYSTPSVPLQVIPRDLLFPVLGTETVQAPTNLRQTSGVGIENVGVSFEDLSLAETGYEVQRSTDQSFATGVTTTTLSADSTRFNETGNLVSGTTYYYRVRTLGPGGPSAFSSTVSITPQVGGSAITLGGTATYLNGADNTRGTTDDAVRLTDNINGQTGTLYSTNAQQINVAGQGPAGASGFTSSFDFRIPEASNPPADGFAFVIQRNSPTATGGAGGGLGYAGVGQSIAVTIDTYPDPGGRNETGLYANGELNDTGTATGLNFTNGNTYRVVLSYDATAKTLTETITNLTDATMAPFTITYTTADGPGTSTPEVDIAAITGGQFGYVGLVGATGGLNNEVQVSNFTFNGVQFIPQPAVGPATISEVYVRGTTWGAGDADAANLTFTEYLESKGLGDDAYGYRLFGTGRVAPAPGSPNEDEILPWINMDQLVVRYTSAPGAGAPTPGALTVNGQKSGYTIVSVTPVATDPTAFILTLNKPLGGGNPTTGVAPTANENGDIITLTVPGGGAAGSGYSLKMNVLQGDTDHLNEGDNHVVLARDFSEVKKKFFKTTNNVPAGTDADYNPFYDVDASGNILARDFSEVKKRFFQSLNTAPVAPASVEGTSITKDMFSTAAIL